jgi:8-oxo-dGTP pyrophosphatase MutT (NUDIX family)
MNNTNFGSANFGSANYGGANFGTTNFGTTSYGTTNYGTTNFGTGTTNTNFCNNFCNNCGNKGHIFYQCKQPITSVGIIVFRKNDEGVRQYLMIRRKDSIGYVEFMRGKYNIYSKMYLMNIISEMTLEEKDRVLNNDFDILWRQLWGDDINAQYRGEEKISRDKFESLKNGIVINSNEYSLESLINESGTAWTETEWGFPKGRHNNQEKDLLCALREFEEETGYLRSDINIIQNILPIEEIFTGSNYKSYKHKYFIASMENIVDDSSVAFQDTEVSKMEWKTYEETMNIIRPYNLEKKEVLARVEKILNTYKLYNVM